MAKKTSKRDKKDKKRRKKGKPTLAERADKYVHYQDAVQEPEAEVEFFDRVYKGLNGRLPKVLREDFCGTFAICCQWAKKRGRTAIGVDLDPEPLAWGREHNLSKISTEAQERVRLLQKDVRSVGRTKADVLAAQNFSFWIFKTRAEVLRYFRAVHSNLAEDGIFVTDMMGGSECFEDEEEEVRKIKGAKYVWEHDSFDPITHDATFHISFRFKDKSELTHAFTYEWRLWTIPEVRELLAEAGFRDSTVYWEGTEEDTGEGDGDFQPAETADADPSWVCYIVARK